MSRIALAFLACSVLGGPVFAAEPPGSGKASAPVPVPVPAGRAIVPYNSQADVVVLGTVGGMSNITFPPRQTVVRVMFAPAGAWEGPDPKELVNTPLKNNLTIWAEKPGRARMVVHTRDDRGDEKAHQFLLIARPDPNASPVAPGAEMTAVLYEPGVSGGDAPPPASPPPPDTVGVTITDPGRERAERAEQARAAWQARRVSWEEREARRVQVATKVRLEEDAAAGPCNWQNPGPGGNWRYTGWGSTEIAPVQICDDGMQVYLRYQGNLRVPAVFAVGADGTEQSVSAGVRGDTLVLQRVAEELHLRLGDAVLHVFNKGFHPVGVNPATGRQADPETGTTTPNVVRGLRVRRASAS